MKKYLFLVVSSVLMFACSGNKQQVDEAPEVVQEQIQAVEQSVEKLDESIKSSSDEFEKQQSEIDSLLNNL
jgi:outer membrane murein-binding lipoprotein Lpp